jgi:hypothetical protein
MFRSLVKNAAATCSGNIVCSSPKYLTLNANLPPSVVTTLAITNFLSADDVGGLAEVGLVGEDLDAGALGDGDYGLVAAEVDADGDRLWGWGLLGLL